MGFASPRDGNRVLDLSAHESSRLPVTGVVETYPANHVVPLHRHRRAHLLHAVEGVMLVQASTGQWLVPPTAAVWLRPDVEHRLVMHTPVRVYGIFVDAAAADGLPFKDGVLHVSALLKALIAELAQPLPDRSDARRETLLSALFLQELGSQRPLPFHLPWPVDGPIQRVCETLVRDPASVLCADDWAASLAMSARTFHRRFRKGTGMTFGRWRQQLRLMASITTLLDGAPITQVALNSGYESHSAYAVAFKKHFGVPPSKFLSAVYRP